MTPHACLAGELLPVDEHLDSSLSLFLALVLVCVASSGTGARRDRRAMGVLDRPR